MNGGATDGAGRTAAPPLPWQPGLVRLALRRALPGRTLVLLVLVGIAAVLQDWELPADVPHADRLARGFVRQGIWTLLTLVLAPLLVHRAAATFREWREGDAEWLAARPGGGTSLLLSTFGGLWLAGALAFALTAVVGELAVGEAGPTQRLLLRADNPPAVLFADDAPVRWVQEDVALGALPAGSVARVHLTVAPGSGPAVTARVTAMAEPEAPGERPMASARLFGRRAVEVAVPAVDGGVLALEVAREGEGAVLVLPAAAVEIYAPVANDRVLAGTLLRRLLLASAAWIALGLGLGAWMRPALAGTLVLAVWVVPWWWGVGAGWMPGGDLPLVWSMLGEGLAPPARGLGEWGATAGIVVLGLALARPGLARGRWIG